MPTSPCGLATFPIVSLEMKSAGDIVHSTSPPSLVNNSISCIDSFNISPSGDGDTRSVRASSPQDLSGKPISTIRASSSQWARQNASKRLHCQIQDSALLSLSLGGVGIDPSLSPVGKVGVLPNEVRW